MLTLSSLDVEKHPDGTTFVCLKDSEALGSIVRALPAERGARLRVLEHAIQQLTQARDEIFVSAITSDLPER